MCLYRVCLRYHLLGIAETYSVLKSIVPQAKTVHCYKKKVGQLTDFILHLSQPVSHVVSVLKQSQSRYLGTSALRHLRPPPKLPIEPSPRSDENGATTLMCLCVFMCVSFVSLACCNLVVISRAILLFSRTILEVN